MKWTPEQQQAIDSPKPGSRSAQTLLVAAAAGSGKTAVLVERIIQRLQDTSRPLSIQELLVVTFTKAAAAEMRARIGAKLSEVFSETGHAYLEEQLSLLPSAHISTLHSFCQWVISNYFYRIDLDPSFRIGNESELLLIKAEVLDELLIEAYENNLYHIYGLADMFGTTRSDEGVKEQVLDLHRFVMAQDDPLGWLNKGLALYEKSAHMALKDTIWGQYFWQKQQEQIATIEARYEEMKELIALPEGPYAWDENVSSVAYIVEALKGATTWDEMVAAAALGAAHKYKQFRTTKYKEGLHTGAISAAAVSKTHALGLLNQNELKAMSHGPFGITEEQFAWQMEQQLPYIKGLIELTKAFMEAFQERKKEEGMVDFSDLEHLCLQILRDKDEDGQWIPSEVALELQEQFKEIMVDEYQDTSGVQEAIVNLVSRKDNRFYVGDVKQSIYRFRMANPGLFLHKYNTFGHDVEDEERRIDLAKNFRSDENILDFTNFLFSQIMTTDGAELDYGKAEALYAGRKVKDAPSNWVGGAVELHVLDVGDGKSAVDEQDASNSEPSSAVTNQAKSSPAVSQAQSGVGTSQSPSNGKGNTSQSSLSSAAPVNGSSEGSSDEKDELDNQDKEIAFVVEKIEQLMAGNYVVEEKDGSFRPLMYRDIVILLRSTEGKGNRIVEALRAKKIPAYAESKSGYFSAIEIKLLLALLQIIDNPEQDLSMAIVLASSFVGMDANELGRLRLTGEGSLWSVLPEYAKSTDNRALQVFVERLERWRTYSRRHSVSELLWTIYEEMNYLEYVSAMPNGLVRRANVMALYTRAKQYESGSFRGLFRFLRFLESLQAAGKDLGQGTTVSEADDVVRIMTIHKSKGLEFPVVFLMSTNKKFNDMDLRKSMILDSESGIGLKGYYEDYRLLYGTFPWLYARDHAAHAMKAEEERVLYVALTRARDKLFITGYIKGLESFCQSTVAPALVCNDEKFSSALIQGANSYLDWIVMALGRHIEGNILRVHSGVEEVRLMDLPYKSCKVAVSVHDGNAYRERLTHRAKESEMLSAIRQLAPIEASPLPDFLAKRFDFAYPYEAATERAAKISVSELKRRFAEMEEEAQPLADSLPVIGLEGIEKGEINSSAPSNSLTVDAVQDGKGITVAAQDAQGTAVEAQDAEERIVAAQSTEDNTVMSLRATDTEATPVEELASDNEVDLGIFSLAPASFRAETALQSGVQWGTLMHEAMQWLPLKDYTKESLSEALDTLTLAGYFTEEERHVLGVGSLYRFFTSSLGRRLLKSQRVEREWPFSLLLEAQTVYKEVPKGEQLFLQGIIDTVFLEDGAWVLVDYKTDRVRSGEELKQRYALQLRMYKEALETLTHIPVKETYIYSFRLHEAVKI
ncbi:UvrD-helicase domain-containing protein [uncultured Veillonella sp.]|uniref:UvrD-helicase domain-containing protein n=1 Tax=uncultured Veillonella sp. TaxID=159268 RepID=UPI00260B1B67|nr:UvrD-helicase domain-containing protein [uncultured Veillonella sp.]